MRTRNQMSPGFIDYKQHRPHGGYGIGLQKYEDGSLLAENGPETDLDFPNNASLTNNTIPMMRSKDTVNQYLKTTTVKQLTSIEEKSLTPSSSEDTSSINEDFKQDNDQRAVHPQTFGKSAPPSTPGESSQQAHHKSKLNASASYRKHSNSKRSSAYPDLEFLENDVGLWDAFFLHGKNSQSHRYLYYTDQCCLY